jgi:O-phospho-L-seryl-tRNASec:L-selenocysteinyl-tRNA synthase
MVEKDSKFTKYAAEFVGENYAKLASDSLLTTERKIHNLMTQRTMPDQGWSDLEIRCLLNRIALMDSNNFEGNCGVGEREGRIFS